MTTPRKLKVGSKNDPQQTSLSSRFGAHEHNRDTGQFDWAGCNPMLMAEAIARCVGGGDAVMFGRTRDGGAGVTTILSGDERHRFYPADCEAANVALMQISWAYSTEEQRREFPTTFVPLRKM